MGSTGLPARPPGVTLVVFLTLAQAVLPLLWLARAPAPTTQSTATEPAFRRQVQVAAAWSAVGLVAAAGLFGMRRWGYWLAVVYYAGAGLLHILRLAGLTEGTRQAMPTLFQLGLAVLIIWYLWSSDVRAAFRRR